MTTITQDAQDPSLETKFRPQVNRRKAWFERNNSTLEPQFENDVSVRVVTLDRSSFIVLQNATVELCHLNSNSADDVPLVHYHPVPEVEEFVSEKWLEKNLQSNEKLLKLVQKKTAYADLEFDDERPW